MARHAIGGAVFALAVIGWFWAGTLAGVGLGLTPLATHGEAALRRGAP